MASWDCTVSVDLTVTGITYFYNNTKKAEVLLSDEGFRFLSACALLSSQSLSVRYELVDGTGEVLFTPTWSRDLIVTVDPDLPSGTVILPSQIVNAASRVRAHAADPATVAERFSAGGTKSGDGRSVNWVCPLDGYRSAEGVGRPDDELTVSPDLFTTVTEGVEDGLYKQVSLFFASDKAAKRAIEGINDKGYLAVLSNTTYSPDPSEIIVSTVLFVLSAAFWFLALLFFAFFVSLCCGRSIDAFRGDMSIMRSMGIPVRVIRIGMYVRMLLSLVPAYLLSGVAVFFIFRTPALNRLFRFPDPWQFVLITVGIVALALLSTRRQIRRLFKTSVKTALRGGDVA